MSDISVLGDFDQFEVSQKYKKQQDEKFFKWIKILVGILAIVFCIEILVFKIIHPSLNTPKLVFVGNQNYSTEYLLNELTSYKGQSWFSFDVAGIGAQLSSISGIEDVDIKRVFPDKIKITVTERKSVAMIFLNQGEHTVPIQIDKNGILFENINGKVADDGSIPIVSGIPIEHLSTGMRIPVKYRVLIDQIAEIQSLKKKHFAGISEICVVPKTYGNYELMLIPANSKVRILISRFLSVEVLDCMLVVLDVVNSVEPNVSEIDLRYNSVSYKIAGQKKVGGEDFD